MVAFLADARRRFNGLFCEIQGISIAFAAAHKKLRAAISSLDTNRVERD